MTQNRPLRSVQSGGMQRAHDGTLYPVAKRCHGPEQSPPPRTQARRPPGRAPAPCVYASGQCALAVSRATWLFRARLLSRSVAWPRVPHAVAGVDGASFAGVEG